MKKNCSKCIHVGSCGAQKVFDEFCEKASFFMRSSFPFKSEADKIDEIQYGLNLAKVCDNYIFQPKKDNEKL